MRKHLVVALVMVSCLVAMVGLRVGAKSKADKKEPQVAHMVFFTLKDKSPAAQKNLVAACNKYLSKHEGEVYYSAGTRATEFDRAVNDQEFDVALHIVFANKTAHDGYQVHKRHKQFIAENKDNWKKVRVFDSLIEK